MSAGIRELLKELSNLFRCQGERLAILRCRIADDCMDSRRYCPGSEEGAGTKPCHRLQTTLTLVQELVVLGCVGRYSHRSMTSRSGVVWSLLSIAAQAGCSWRQRRTRLLHALLCAAGHHIQSSGMQRIGHPPAAYQTSMVNSAPRIGLRVGCRRCASSPGRWSASSCVGRSSWNSSRRLHKALGLYPHRCPGHVRICAFV